MSRVKLHLIERADFAKYYDAAVAPGEIFVPTSEGPGAGEAITVEVVFQGGPRVLLQGSVKWRRPAGDARARVGVGVAIAPTEDAKLNYLRGYVRGGLIDVREKRRLPVRLRVAYSGARGRRINFTRDLNEEGAFVRASELLEVGARTVLQVTPPGDYKPLEIHAVVTRLQTDRDRGMGVRFEFQTDEQRAILLAFVERLENEYLDGKLPDEALL